MHVRKYTAIRFGVAVRFMLLAYEERADLAVADNLVLPVTSGDC
jgi:hypothetical protein